MLERTSHYLKAGLLREKPAWFNVVGSNPPMTDLTKKAKLFQAENPRKDPGESIYQKKNHQYHFNKVQYKTRTSSVDRKHRHDVVSKLPKLHFLEDQLRDVFYHQHPWEFARPKVLVENEGNDNDTCNWSHMLQLSKPLDGESVVQRTLWLLKDSKKQGDASQPLSLFEAYDKARFEFYRLRMDEEMSSTVSKEESTMLGTVFNTTHLDWGVAKEQEFVDVWAQVATEQTQIYEAQRGGKMASHGSMGAEEDEAVNDSSAWVAAEEKVE